MRRGFFVWLAVGVLCALAVLAVVSIWRTPSPAALEVRNYIERVATNRQVIAGQYLGNPWILTDLSEKAAGESEITRVHQLTGKFLGMIGLDWLNCDRFPDHGASVIQLAKDYWRRGGLVTFCWHEGNPRVLRVQSRRRRAGSSLVQAQPEGVDRLVER